MLRTLATLAIIVLTCSCYHSDGWMETAPIQSAIRLIEKAETSKITQMDSALFHAQRAYRMSVEEEYNLGIARSSLIIGDICYHKGEFNQANEYLIKSLQYFDGSIHSIEMGRAYNLLGRVYQYTGQQTSAIEHYRTALKTFAKIDHLPGLAETFGNVGHFNEKQGRYDSALFYQNKAKDIYTSLNDSSGLAHIYDNIGSIYEDLEQFDRAQVNFESAYETNVRLGNEAEALINLNNLGDILRKTSQFQKATEITTEVLKKAKKLRQHYQVRSAYRDLGKIYQAIGKSDLAYLYLDSCYQINSEIYSQEIANEIAETRTVYEVEQKEQQIALLKKDQEINLVTKASLLGISILLFSIGGLVYLQLRIRIRKNKKIYEAEKELARANEHRLQTELSFKRFQEEKLHQELEIKSRELTTNALHIIQKNEFLGSLKSELKDIKKSKDEMFNKKLKSIIKSIDYNFNLDDDWQEFETIFQQVHAEFFEQLRKDFPDLTSAEIRLCAMLRLNLNSKDIATIMGISQDSLRISRYRLRKKLGIDKGSNLYSFIMTIG